MIMMTTSQKIYISGEKVAHFRFGVFPKYIYALVTLQKVFYKLYCQ